MNIKDAINEIIKNNKDGNSHIIPLVCAVSAFEVFTQSEMINAFFEHSSNDDFQLEIIKQSTYALMVANALRACTPHNDATKYIVPMFSATLEGGGGFNMSIHVDMTKEGDESFQSLSDGVTHNGQQVDMESILNGEFIIEKRKEELNETTNIQ